MGYWHEACSNYNPNSISAELVILMACKNELLLPGALLFFVEKMCESFAHTAKDSHIFSTKNYSVFVTFTFKILTKR